MSQSVGHVGPRDEPSVQRSISKGTVRLVRCEQKAGGAARASRRRDPVGLEIIDCGRLHPGGTRSAGEHSSATVFELGSAVRLQVL